LRGESRAIPTTLLRKSLADHQQLDQARALLRSKYRAFADILDRTHSTFGDAWAAEFDALLAALFPTNERLAVALHGYVKFVTDSMRLQAAFEKTRTYKSSSYDDAARRVYHNDDYMMSEYLPGLLLSHFLWPHHYRQLIFFDSAFIRYMKDAGASRFAEVGIGTGLYSRRVLEALPAADGTGYDISPSVRTFAAAHMAAYGQAHRYRVRLQNILTEHPNEQFEAVVCVEVLEHLEDPVAFLVALRRMLGPGGRAFVTAAVSADHADHIYLYETAAEVEAHIVEAGFAVEQAFAATAYPAQYSGQPVPVAAAFIVQ
jgi:2-polyprenyl-3-methyl-5-hydroxy-6-metoxy-1,4-benzoquinol methylase